MANNPEIGNAVSMVFGDLRVEILYLPIWRRLPLIRSIRWGRAVKRLNRSIRTTIKSRRSSGETGHDLLSSLLTARNSDGYSMSDEQLHDEILTFFLAGHETALSLTWATYLLATHPEMQERVNGVSPTSCRFVTADETRVFVTVVAPDG
jgi:cytochrome P450